MENVGKTLFLFCEPFPKQPAPLRGLSGRGEGSQKRRSFILSKTILGQLNGFTPVIDGMIPEVGAMTALVFGKAWRYCQMSDGVCKASQDRIADELGLSRATINTHLSKLVEAGYLEDMTPNLLGLPHQYRDTGKANLSISFTGNVSKNLTPTSQKSLHPPVKNIDTKIPIKKESRENEDEERTAEIGEVYKTYQSEIGVITPMIAESIDGWIKDGFPLKWLCDAFHESSAQGKRSWKYCEAIIKRWKAQGNQNEMKPQQARKPVITEPAAFEAIRQFERMQNGNQTGN